MFVVCFLRILVIDLQKIVVVPAGEVHDAQLKKRVVWLRIKTVLGTYTRVKRSLLKKKMIYLSQRSSYFIHDTTNMPTY